MYPKKGTIAVGGDADIVVFDPEKRATISAKTHHSASDINIFEGTEVQGSPEIVLRRGNVIVEGDELLAEPGSGQFVRRAKFREELKSADALAPLARLREAEVDLRGGRVGPARGDDLRAGVEVDPLRPVDVAVAEEATPSSRRTSSRRRAPGSAR